MIILAIETSTSIGSLALARDGRILEERALPGFSRSGGRFLVPELKALLARQHLSPREIELVAVSIGPGGFTGLRIGLTCAKTLAWAHRIPLVAVDTFAAIAENSPQAKTKIKTIAVLADAQRRGVLAGIYRKDAGDEPPARWQRQGEFQLIPRDEIADRLAEVDLLSGPGLVTLHRDQSQTDCQSVRQPSGPPHAPSAEWLPRAATIARDGERLYQHGELADPHSLEPRYTRPSAAEEKRRSTSRAGG